MKLLLGAIAALVATSALAGNKKHINKYAHLAKSCKTSFQSKLSKPLESAHEAKLDSQLIYASFEVKTEYPVEVMNQAKNLVRRGIKKEDLQGRLDLRAEDFITIDGKETIDRDDAILVRKMRNGNYHLSVAVPDMAHYIKPSSPIGQWIFSQATSHYLRDMVFHMLPRELVSGLLSIDPKKDRLAVVYQVEFDVKKKEFKHFKVDKAILRSKAAISYEEFQEKMNNPELQEKHEYHAIELYRMLKESKKPSLSFPFSTEMKANFDENNNVVGFERFKTNESNHLIELFMVSINSMGAKWMESKNIPGIFRGQDEPSEKRVKLFFETLTKLGRGIEYKEELSVFDNLQRGFNRLKGYKHPEVVTPLLFYVTQPAENMAYAFPHYNLNVQQYSFLTSPIRRVSDYWNQFMIGKYLEGKLESEETFAVLSKQAVLIENDNGIMRDAKRAEGQWLRTKMIRLNAPEVGMGYEAIIAREFADYDLVYLPEKKLYVQVEKDSMIPKNPFGKTGKKVLIQILSVELDSGTVYGTYR